MVLSLEAQLGDACFGFDRVGAIETGQTEAGFWLASGLDHPGKAQVA